MDMRSEIDNATALSLLSQVASGDHVALNEIWRSLNWRIIRFAERMLGNRADAEEVRNDTMMELVKEPLRFRGDSKFSVYVLGIARNKALTVLRSRGRDFIFETEEELAAGATEDVPPDQKLLNDQLRQAISHCMDAIASIYRVAIHLAYFEELSRVEIAVVCNCSANLVRQRVHEGLKKLKPCMDRVMF